MTGKEPLKGFQLQWRKNLRQQVERAAVYLRLRNKVETAWLIEQFETVPAAQRFPMTNRMGDVVGQKVAHPAGWLITCHGFHTSAKRLAP